MDKQTAAPDRLRATRQFMAAGLTCSGLATASVVAALAVPIAVEEQATGRRSFQSVPEIQPPQFDQNTLLVKVAGSRLIRPTQVQAAIKDTGAAQRLLKQLKLQSVTSIRGESVAYVRIDQSGVKSIRENERILDFIVESVKPGEVKLSLDGVVVSLSY